VGEKVNVYKNLSEKAEGKREIEITGPRCEDNFNMNFK
jgi:hypothetical protein